MKTRGEAIERVFVLLKLLRPLRKPISERDAAEQVRKLSGRNYCRRTVTRDVQLLERFGLISRSDGYIRKVAEAW
jgi:repressor of nif and glnA expression